MDDRAIVELFWARSERAVAEAEAKYGGLCFSVAQRIVPTREDAEECVQDALVHAWEAIPPQRPERLGAFLAKITRNLALDRVRLEAREKRGGRELILAYEELEAVLSDGGSLADELALRQVLQSFLGALPQKTRAIFLRRYWYFQPIREIAKELSVSESRVKMTLLRTRNALREHLKQEELL